MSGYRAYITVHGDDGKRLGKVGLKPVVDNLNAHAKGLAEEQDPRWPIRYDAFSVRSHLGVPTIVMLTDAGMGGPRRVRGSSTVPQGHRLALGDRPQRQHPEGALMPHRHRLTLRQCGRALAAEVGRIDRKASVLTVGQTETLLVLDRRGQVIFRAEGLDAARHAVQLGITAIRGA